jgi:hypothetical protein
MRLKRTALMLALASCGYTPPPAPHGSPDAAGTPIVPPMPAPPDGVALSVTEDGAPVVGAPVYFQNADSTLKLASQTDPNGTVGAPRIDGGFVTVLLRAPGDGNPADAVDQLFTFAGVLANDRLHLDLRAPVTDHGVQYDTTLAALVGSAASYGVYSACSDEPNTLNGSGSGEVVLAGCSTSASLVLVARDGDGNAVSAETLPNVMLVDPGGGFGSDFPTEPLVLPSQFAPLVNTSITVADVPSAFGSVSGTLGVLDAEGRAVFEVTNSAPISGGAASVPLSGVPQNGSGEVTVVTTDLQPGGGAVGEQVIATWGSAATSYTVDVGSNVLAEYTAAPTLAGSAVSWSETGGAKPDLVRVAMTLSRPSVLGHTWSWHLVGPRAATPSLALPTLPFDGQFDYNPAATDAAAFVELTSAHVPGGYDAIRATAFGSLTGITTPAGSLAIETVFVPAM